MRTVLIVSLAANLVLAGVLHWERSFWRNQRLVTPQTPSWPRPPASQTPQHLVFDWGRQVEAGDYPSYIANLRAIRCPEQTIRDIIRADIANLFAQKRRELARSPDARRWSTNEETRLLASLFGDPVPEGPSTAAAGSLNEEFSPPVRLPLILQAQALAKLKLNDEQREELGELAQEFIQEVGGVNQDPNDPEYLAKWQKAQPKFDQMIVTAIGRRALVDLDEALPPPDSNNQ